MVADKDDGHGAGSQKRGGWLSRFAPGVRRASDKRDTPENLWIKSPDSGEMLYRPDLEAALWVTPTGRHMRIGPEQRFRYTFDDGKWETVEPPGAVDDPLKFRDDKPYRERLDAARKATGEADAMAIGIGSIEGQAAVALVQDFAFMGGSLGMAAGEGFIAAAQQAVRRGIPLVAFTAAGGARMQEGALSLMQMARTTLAIGEVKAAGLPYIVVLTDPTTGGVTASYAMLGDVHLAEPGALIGFAGPRVIEQTIREVLPEGFQRAEFLQEKGMVDRVVPRAELPRVLGSILRTLMLGREAPPGGMTDLLRASDRALERLQGLHPKKIDLSLERIERLLRKVGRPQDRLPPVVHVAGTNGKGSTVAFVRAIAEAAGLKVHVLTSPHLVRFVERIRLAGELIGDVHLARVLERLETANAGEPITFFEITTAAALVAFAEVPADLSVIEVGLGGRFDATNVIEAPAVSVIAPVDYDHAEFLGTDLAKIAWEKAGIIKRGRPVVSAGQAEAAEAAIRREAERHRAPLQIEGQDFHVSCEGGRLVFQDEAGLEDLPPPGLIGEHQIANAGLAVAAVRALNDPRITPHALAEGVAAAAWPARFQRLSAGPYGERARERAADLWLDGAHNPHAARAAAAQLARLARDGRPAVVIAGLLANKDAGGVFEAFRDLQPRVIATAFDAPTAADPEALREVARAAGLEADVASSPLEALQMALPPNGPPPHVLICGSLYLAGEVLAASPQTWPR